MRLIPAYAAIYLLCLTCVSPAVRAATQDEVTAADISIESAQFDHLADGALLAMRQKAEATKVGGVAVIAFFKAEKIESWSSKMVVVGRVKDEPNGTQKGSNLLAIAYAKAAEMADTLIDSGSQSRPPMIGEFGWQGGVIVRVKTGYVIAAFSGGQSAEDVAVSRAGLTQMLDQSRSPAKRSGMHMRRRQK